MVQIGNEVRVGMLWPEGKLPDKWDNFAEYIQAGINGVDAGRGNGKRPRIMVQYDNGASLEGSRGFFDKLFTYGIPIDVIGYSYYPWWHGSIQMLRENLNATAQRYGKEVMVVEAAYHYGPNGETNGRKNPFPITPEGQAQFLEEVTRAVMDVPNGMGTGVFWWEPTLPRSTRGMFDKDGKALPVVYVFDKFALH
jgi:arabinogalactan endo-1,4-beta-galactosidase